MRTFSRTGQFKKDVKQAEKRVVLQFELIGHPKAKRAYAWSHSEGKDDKGERFVAVLEIPPVNSPETAVRAAIVADAKKGYSK